MNGKELLEALSFLDEDLLEEPAQVKKIPWRRWVSLAACLCVLIFGVVSLTQLKNASVTEGMADECAPETLAAAGAAPEAPQESADTAEENRTMDNYSAESAAEEAPLKVRLVELTEGGFVAQVLTEDQDLEGLTVTVLLTEDARVPELIPGEIYEVHVLSPEADGTLWATAVEPAAQEE